MSGAQVQNEGPGSVPEGRPRSWVMPVLLALPSGCLLGSDHPTGTWPATSHRKEKQGETGSCLPRRVETHLQPRSSCPSASRAQ